MSWDDGKHKKVKKIQLTFDNIINSIQVEYDGTTLQSQLRGTIGAKSDGFMLSTDEYITEVNGFSRTLFSGDVITALTFKTNKKTYGPYGKQSRSSFSISAPNGNQIAGFLGTSGNALNSIDVHFAPIPPTGATETNPVGNGNTSTPEGPGTTSGTKPGGTGTPPGTNSGGNGTTPGTKPGGSGTTHGTTPGNGTNTESNPQKMGPGGGKGGNEWDDTANHDGVTKIYVVHGALGIEQIKFDYLKNGETKEGPFHGIKKGSSISTFEINHPNEYLVSVMGWYDSSNIIQGIGFRKATKASYFIGYAYAGEGKEFSFEVEGKKIIGFHGFAGSHLNSLGAYFVPITSTTPLKPGVKTLKAIGGDEGVVWDDGDFDGVRKIKLQDKDPGIGFVEIEYNKGSQVIKGDRHGIRFMTDETFELDYPSEYITAVKGTFETFPSSIKEGQTMTLVVSLVFVTNKQESKPFGITGSGKHFEIKEEGHKIVGFHGKAGNWIHQIGVHVAPITN